MLGRLLQVIQWISFAGCCLGLFIWFWEGIVEDNPIRKSELEISFLFVGQYIGYVVVLWIIKHRWIWFPWQYNKD
jgi:hypothetical protein